MSEWAWRLGPAAAVVEVEQGPAREEVEVEQGPAQEGVVVEVVAVYRRLGPTPAPRIGRCRHKRDRSLGILEIPD